MPSAVVFDTNSYQGLPSGVVDSLLAVERERDILACADNWVMIELIAKLVDPDRQTFARAALKKLWAHCGADALRMVVDCEEQVCRVLFDQSPPDHREVRERVRDVAGQVAATPADQDIEGVLGAARELRAHVDKVERDRSDTILNEIVRAIVPGADSWDAVARRPELRDQAIAWIDAGEAVHALAMSEVRRAHLDLALPIPDPLPKEMVETVLEHFTYPLEVDSAAIRAVLQHGSDPTIGGRQNTIWDAQIAFNAGQTILDGRTILLVTDDNLLHEVAQHIHQNQVQRLAAYLDACGIAA